jgi:CheY-like chemotaxis protein
VPDQRGCECARDPQRAGPQGVTEGKARHAADSKVLVVEDDATVRTALAELIQIWGYSLETASDGLEALNKASSSPPTVVISDLDMPRMGGLELLKALQNSAPDVNCIIVTAHASTEEAGLAGTPGVVDFLEKPIDVKRLRQDLRECLEPANVPDAPARLYGGICSVSENIKARMVDAAVCTRISDRAYEIYCRRGRREGLAMQDWLQAEAEVLNELKFTPAAAVSLPLDAQPK